MVSKSAGALKDVDVWVKLASLVRPFLKSRVMDHQNSAVLQHNLKDPVPRKVYDAVVRCPSPEIMLGFFAILEKGQANRHKVRTIRTKLLEECVIELTISGYEDD